MSGNQNWRTPPEFLAAFRKRFGSLDWDLAATQGHEVATLGRFFSPEDDSLKQDWRRPLGRVRYLNPPFAHIRPWAQKCAEVQFCSFFTGLLVPASMGSMWWRDHVLGQAMAFGIPRMRFVGAKDLYPKDLALVLYGFGIHGTGFWDWRKDVIELTAAEAA